MTIESSAGPSVATALPARRRWLLAGVGAAAALAGAGLAAWRLRLSPVPPEAALPALWGASFQTPQGGTLDMQLLRGRPLLINFWATWCPPCVEEMPLLDSFYRQNLSNGWQVVGLAIDQPSAVRAFLTRVPVSFPIGLAGLQGSELTRTLGNLTGGLPFTVVFDGKGLIHQRKMGRVEEADLAAWAGLR